jgi:CRP-like cAMP-binding protein
MLDAVQTDTVFQEVATSEATWHVPDVSSPVRSLGAGERLVTQGDRKGDLYRVVSGTLCAHAMPPGGREETVTFYHKGELIGAGRLSSYPWSVTAMTDAVVSRLPMSALDALLACEPALALRRETITEIEFEALRRQLTATSADDRMRRVANLLIVLARTNAHEGRDMRIIRDDLGCGEVAQQLGFGIDELAAALTGLGRLGLVDADVDGALRLVDLPRLEAFADAA